MFVLTLNAFRQRCFHNFQHPRKFIARLFDSRLCSWCVTFPFFLYTYIFRVQLSETYPIKSFAHRA